MSRKFSPITGSSPSKLFRHKNISRSHGHHRRRFLSMEALEGRSLLAALVADVLKGTADTTVVGTVYEDVNSNGVRDGGENGIPGWTVYLDLDNSGTLNTDAAGTLEPSALTNRDGDYVINHLVPGNYRAGEIVQSGWTATSPVSQDVTVKQSKDTRADFFNFSGGDIVGAVWNDLSADGVRATDPATGEFTEPGLAGWTIFLDINNNGSPDAGEPTSLSGSDGSYSFLGLPPGDYEVTEVLPSGWDVSPHFDTRQTAAVVARLQAVQDFANFSTSNGSIQGTIWNDTNANGVRETDPTLGEFTEPGLADWTVFLDLNNDRSQDPGEPTALTDANGNYSFISLVAGDYEVVEILPDGWDVSPTFDSQQTVAVSGGEVSTANDFANFTTLNGSIRGAVWNDVNRNGVRDYNSLTGDVLDPGLANWTILLDLNRNRLADSGEPTTLTDANGNYTFADLQVGDYEVQEVLPTGWEASTTYSDSQTVTVYSGIESIAPDFANFNVAVASPGSVRGTVWNDLNGNGLRDASDLGLSGWTVFVDSNSDGLLSFGEQQATSAADGSYALSGILPGTTQVVAQSTVGWRATAPLTNTRTIALKSGDAVTGLDFGEAELKDSTIRGVLFADSDKDRIRDAGERGLGDITVYLDLNNNAQLDTGEPQVQTSADLYYTPGVDEAGTYSFTHLARGTYAVREVIPAVLEATPASEREHVVTITSAEDRGGVDFAAIFRANQIHGTKFDDVNGNHLRDAGEAGVAGATIFVDLDRDNIHDAEEPSTVTLADGSYAFTDLVPGAYVIREIVAAGHTQSSPTTLGGIMWPSGVSNPAVGNVNPLSISTSLGTGENYRQTVSLTLPNTGALTNLVDVFLLFDDTGSFVNNSPIVRAAFPDIISQLQSSLPGIDLGFGVGRLEEYGNFAYEYATGRPFILNQPVVAASSTGYLSAIQAALNRTTPGYGGDQPETDIEALYQLVTGQGFDGNNNGSVLDSGAAGLASTQLNPGSSGDVPSFASFTADPANSVMPAAGSIGGAGFRAGALPIILLATDTGFAYQPQGVTTITGVGGVALPVSALTQTSRSNTPFNSGAGIQQTITGLNALGALVIGLGTNPQSTLDPRQGLESLSKLTGATNQSTTTIANGTADPIAPGDPFYFQIASGFGASVANGVVSAIQNAVTNVAIDIAVQASDPRVHIINHTGTLHGVGAGATATFDIEFQGDGIPHRFDLQFVRAGTNVVLGSIPVVIGTPIPGDGYEFDDLQEGEIEYEDNFSDYFTGTVPVNVAPSFVKGSDLSLAEDAGHQAVAAWATSISPGPTSETSQQVDFLVTNNNSALFSVQPGISSDGTLTFTPAANAYGAATVTVRAHDNGGTANGGTDTSDNQSFTIVVTPVNDAPLGADDSYETLEDTTLSISARGVLANDTDMEGDPLTVALLSGPSHGSLFLNADGSFLYSPSANFTGTDSFTYRANDGAADSNIVTVSILVTPVNNAPVAMGDYFSTQEDTVMSIAASGLLTNDMDVESDPLSAILVSGPSHGTLALSLDGSFSYSPHTNFAGEDSFIYKANDGTADSNEVTVNLTVTPTNDIPTAKGDTYSTPEDTALSIAASGVLANDVDVESDPLTAILVSGPNNGTLSLNADGSFSYTPSANFNGVDSFTYKANDGAADSNEVTVTIDVTQVNDLPVAVADSYVTLEDTALSILANGVLANDTDADGDALTANLVTGPRHGTLTLGGDGSFLYTPSANFNGTDSFAYKANDGLADSNAVTVNIAVTSVNDAPFGVDDAYQATQGTILTVPVATGVLSNDSDVDGDPLAAILATAPANGTLTLNANGSFIYSPLAGFVGMDSFTYRVSDGVLESSLVSVFIEVKAITTPGGTKFIVVDGTARDTFNYDEAGNYVVRHDLNEEDQKPRGVAANKDGSLYWVVDAKGEVFVHNGDGYLVGSWKVRGIDKPEGIATNGTDLWIVDSETDRIYYFAAGATRREGSARATSSFSLAGGNRDPMDVTSDGVHLWVVNDTSSIDKVFRYSMHGNAEGSWRIDAFNSHPTGLTIDPNDVNHVWIVDAGTDRVYQYSGAASRVSGQQAAALSFALNSADGNPQGIADPWADIALDKIGDAAIAALASEHAPSNEQPSTHVTRDDNSVMCYEAHLESWTSESASKSKQIDDWDAAIQSISAERDEIAIHSMDDAELPELKAKSRLRVK